MSENLIEFLKKKFKPYESNFKETSYDNANDKYLCKNSFTKNVFNFDKYVRDNYDNSNLPSSPDAVYIEKQKLYFVEFKNQYIEYIQPNNIKKKLTKGVGILEDITKEYSYEKEKYKFIFCLVHKKDKNNQSGFQQFEDGISKMTKNASLVKILNSINNKNNRFYDDIIVDDTEFYKENFKLKCEN